MNLKTSLLCLSLTVLPTVAQESWEYLARPLNGAASDLIPTAVGADFIHILNQSLKPFVDESHAPRKIWFLLDEGYTSLDFSEFTDISHPYVELPYMKIPLNYRLRSTMGGTEITGRCMVFFYGETSIQFVPENNDFPPSTSTIIKVLPLYFGIQKRLRVSVLHDQEFEDVTFTARPDSLNSDMFYEIDDCDDKATFPEEKPGFIRIGFDGMDFADRVLGQGSVVATGSFSLPTDGLLEALLELSVGFHRE